MCGEQNYPTNLLPTISLEPKSIPHCRFRYLYTTDVTQIFRQLRKIDVRATCDAGSDELITLRYQIWKLRKQQVSLALYWSSSSFDRLPCLSNGSLVGMHGSARSRNRRWIVLIVLSHKPVNMLICWSGVLSASILTTVQQRSSTFTPRGISSTKKENKSLGLNVTCHKWHTPANFLMLSWRRRRRKASIELFPD